MCSMNFVFCLVLVVLPHWIVGVRNYSICSQAKKPKMLQACCNIPEVNKIGHYCRQFYFNQNKTVSHNGESRNVMPDKVVLHACIAQCIFLTRRYLFVNGTLNLPQMRENFNAQFNDDVLVDLMMNSVTTCFNSVEEHPQSEIDWITSNKCNFYYAMMMVCILEQAYKNCPESKWKNSDDCTTMRKNLIACDTAKNRKI